MQIIHDDNHLLIVSKPPGLATQDSPDCSENLTDLAKAWVKKRYDKPGKVFLEPIHRLDKPVSGLVVFARTSKALSRLQEMMRQRQISKRYFALIDCIPDLKEATLEHYLFHDNYRAKVVSASHPEAKKAILTYNVLSVAKGLVEIELHTGRYHQIRAQFSAKGMPIRGDEKYGSSSKWTSEGIALHHGELTLKHPVTQEKLTFKAPLPSFWKVDPNPL